MEICYIGVFTDSVTVILYLLHELWVTARNSEDRLTLKGSLSSGEEELGNSAGLTYQNKAGNMGIYGWGEVKSRL